MLNKNVNLCLLNETRMDYCLVTLSLTFSLLDRLELVDLKDTVVFVLKRYESKDGVTYTRNNRPVSFDKDFVFGVTGTTRDCDTLHLRSVVCHCGESSDVQKYKSFLLNDAWI